MYDVVNIFKNELFDHFRPLVQENFAVNITENELKLFQRICLSTTLVIRTSFIEYFRTRRIEIGDDITISVKLVIPSNQLVKALGSLTDRIIQDLLRKPSWV